MRICFIIPTYNTLELTKKCLDSLVATVDLPAHETIIIDDRSTDGTGKYLAQLPPEFKVIFNSNNQGYGKNCNQAARMAQGELLCFCNSDLIFLSGWLPPLISALLTQDNPGFIGNIQRSVSTGRIDHLGVRFLSDGRPVHISWDRGYAPIREYLKVSAVTAACCLIRKDLFLKFNGFSEDFRNGFEDTDLCLRLLEGGVPALRRHPKHGIAPCISFAWTQRFRGCQPKTFPFFMERHRHENLETRRKEVEAS